MNIVEKVYKEIKNLKNYYTIKDDNPIDYHYAFVVDLFREDKTTVKEYLIYLLNISEIDIRNKTHDGFVFAPSHLDKKYLVIYNKSFPHLLYAYFDTKIRDNFHIYVDITGEYDYRLVNKLIINNGSLVRGETTKINTLKKCIDASPLITTGLGPSKVRKNSNTSIIEHEGFLKIKNEYTKKLNKIVSNIKRKYYIISEHECNQIAFKILFNTLPESEYVQFVFLMNGTLWHIPFGINNTVSFCLDRSHLINRTYGVLTDDMMSSPDNINKEISYTKKAYVDIVCDFVIEKNNHGKIEEYLRRQLYTNELFNLIKLVNIKNYYTPHVLFTDFYLISYIDMLSAAGTNSTLVSETSIKGHGFFVDNGKQIFFIPSTESDLVYILLNSNQFKLHSVVRIDNEDINYIRSKFDISVVLFNKQPIGKGKEPIKYFGINIY